MTDKIIRDAAEKRVRRYKKVQAEATDPVAAELLEQLRDQLLIVLIRRSGGRVTVPVQEIDATGDLVLSMEVDGESFIFAVEPKH